LTLKGAGADEGRFFQTRKDLRCPNPPDLCSFWLQKSVDLKGGWLAETMIRVFPRKTKMTPDDDLAFIGEPGLFRPKEDLPVKVSVTFTWDIKKGLHLKRSWERYYSDVQIGGVALGDPGGEFMPGRFMKEGVTITSRGCNRRCDHCDVPKREGKIRELPINDGWIVQDNNLLMCSRRHVEAVFEMLSNQPNPANFSGGLDPALFKPWHLNLLNYIKFKFLWFSCDTPDSMPDVERVAGLTSGMSREKKRCYVLVGFNGETIAEAEQRLIRVYELDFLPFAQLYQPGGDRKRLGSPDWRKFVKQWSRPASYKKYMKGRSE